MQKSAGLAIICNNKILLVHPTNGRWSGRHSIPKGGIEIDETKLEAAIRETYEEVGILFKRKNIEPERHKIVYKTKKGVAYKKVYYYIVRLSEEPKLNPDNYQIEEIDWAGFFTYEEAEKVILPKQIEILTHLK